MKLFEKNHRNCNRTKSTIIHHNVNFIAVISKWHSLHTRAHHRKPVYSHYVARILQIIKFSFVIQFFLPNMPVQFLSSLQNQHASSSLTTQLARQWDRTKYDTIKVPQNRPITNGKGGVKPSHIVNSLIQTTKLGFKSVTWLRAAKIK